MKHLYAACLIGLSFLTSGAAWAQNQAGDNPNLRHYYMARQQVQIIDDAPQYNDLRSNPAAQSQRPPAAAPQALPRAGFNSFMSGYAGGAARSGLPQVNNGVPRALPAATSAKGQSASAGKLKSATKTASTAAKTSPIVKGYKPYATAPSNASAVGSGSASSSSSASTSVKGNVLHWNQKRAAN